MLSLLWEIMKKEGIVTMAKIMYGNYNDLPWMPNHKKDVDGKVMCYMKCFAMEAANMHMCIGQMFNGMPIGPHTHPPW